MEFYDLDVELRHGASAVKCYSPEECGEKLHSYVMPSLPEETLRAVHEVCRRAAGILRMYGFNDVDARDLFSLALRAVKVLNAPARKRAEAVAYAYAYKRGFRLPLKGGHIIAFGRFVDKMGFISSAVSRVAGNDPLLYRMLSATIMWMTREKKVSWGGSTIVRVACRIVSLLFPNDYPYVRLTFLAGMVGRNSCISSYLAKLGIKVITTVCNVPVLVELPKGLCEYLRSVHVDLPQHVKCSE